jgi:hypothetical protein
MKKASLLAALVIAFGASTAIQAETVHVKLIGYEEVPAVSSTGSAEFQASIDGDRIHWRLSYENLEGTVTQSHIHVGQTAANGGIVIFLCTNLGNAPAGTTTVACPPAPAMIEGTATAAHVVPQAAQGIAALEIGEVIAAIRAGAAYVNVHTTKHGPGEIRGQFRGSEGHRH